MKIRLCHMLMLCASCCWSQAPDSSRPSSGKTPSLEISRAGTRTSMPGSSANFTGSVRQERVFTSVVPSGAVGGSVTFSPGSRTLWHTHPRGQVLIITEGTGLVQIEGGPIETVHAGDVIKIPANKRHWHGATPTASMTHLSITEAVDGKMTDWMEPVTDQQYLGVSK